MDAHSGDAFSCIRGSNPLISGNKYTTFSCLAAVRGWCFFAVIAVGGKLYAAGKTIRGKIMDFFNCDYPSFLIG